MRSAAVTSHLGSGLVFVHAEAELLVWVGPVELVALVESAELEAVQRRFLQALFAAQKCCFPKKSALQRLLELAAQLALLELCAALPLAVATVLHAKAGLPTGPFYRQEKEQPPSCDGEDENRRKNHLAKNHPIFLNLAPSPLSRSPLHVLVQ